MRSRYRIHRPVRISTARDGHGCILRLDFRTRLQSDYYVASTGKQEARLRSHVNFTLLEAMRGKSIIALGRLFLIAAPPVLIGLLILRDAVNIPFLDQWNGSAPLFAKMAAGTLTLTDFFAQHNEHRMFFPRLLFFGLGRLTHWDIRAELWVIWLLVLICLFNISQLARYSGWKGFSRCFWILSPASLLLFTPLSMENFLWGFQIGFVLPLACVTASIWVAAYIRHPFNFVFAILLCTICTFSIASGLTSWVLTTPLLLFAQSQSNSPTSKRWWAIWTSTFLLELLAYFFHYEKPVDRSSAWSFLTDPLAASEYVLVFLGNPFTYGTTLPPLPLGLASGGLLLLLLLICTSYIWRKRFERGLLDDTLPWLMLAMVGITSAILTMMGRLEFGANQARNSRYIAFAVTLPIALLVLMRMVHSHWTSSFSIPIRRLTKSILFLLMLPFLTATCLGFFAGLPVWSVIRQTRLFGKTLISFINVVPEPEQLAIYMFPDDGRMKATASALARIGYLHTPLLESNLVRNLAQDKSSGPTAVGKFQISRAESKQIELEGWAFLPDKRRPADAILISYDDAQAEPVICALAAVGIPSQLNLRATWDSSALPCNWNRRISTADLPRGHQCVLRAWAFDAETSRVYRLAGSATFDNK